MWYNINTEPKHTLSAIFLVQHGPSILYNRPIAWNSASLNSDLRESPPLPPKQHFECLPSGVAANGSSETQKISTKTSNEASVMVLYRRSLVRYPQTDDNNAAGLDHPV